MKPTTDADRARLINELLETALTVDETVAALLLRGFDLTDESRSLRPTREQWNRMSVYERYRTTHLRYWHEPEFDDSPEGLAASQAWDAAQARFRKIWCLLHNGAEYDSHWLLDKLGPDVEDCAVPF